MDAQGRTRWLFVLLIQKFVNVFTKSSDQRERGGASRAEARIGWRPCRFVVRRVVLLAVLLWISAGAGFRSDNFIVETADPNFAQQVTQTAEKWRHDLAVEWLGQPMPNWAQPCVMTVQAGPNLGAGGATTFVFDHGEVYGWRMSIQGSQERILDSVLPHEITHMVFASQFREPLPRWADEGGATSVEHFSEKNKHRQMLYEYLHTNRGISFSKMFVMTEYPQDIMPLYAQGYSLAEYLIQTGGRRKFIEFLGDGLQSENWTAAVERNYGFKDLGVLQNTWLAWVRQGMPNLNPQNPAGMPGEQWVANNQPQKPEPNLIYHQPNNAASPTPIAATALPAPPTPMYAAAAPSPAMSPVPATPQLSGIASSSTKGRLVPVQIPQQVASASQPAPVGPVSNAVASANPLTASMPSQPQPQTAPAAPPAQQIAAVTMEPAQVLPASGWRSSGKSSAVNAASYAAPAATVPATSPAPVDSTSPAQLSTTPPPTSDPFHTEVTHPLAIEQPRQTIIR